MSEVLQMILVFSSNVPTVKGGEVVDMEALSRPFDEGASEMVRHQASEVTRFPGGLGWPRGTMEPKEQ